MTADQDDSSMELDIRENSPKNAMQKRYRHFAITVHQYARLNPHRLFKKFQRVLVGVGGEGFVGDFVEAGEVNFQVERFGVLDLPEIGKL